MWRQKNPSVFKFEEITFYELFEDQYVIERFNKGDIAPLFTPMAYIPMVHIDYNDKNETPKNISRSFKLKLYLSNLCWDMVELSAGTASGSELNFQRDYNKRLSRFVLLQLFYQKLSV